MIKEFLLFYVTEPTIRSFNGGPKCNQPWTEFDQVKMKNDGNDIFIIFEDINEILIINESPTIMI